MLSGTHHGPALNDTSANLDAGEVLAGTKLSKRQMEVLRLLGQGKSNKEIAKTLFRSPHTIKLHVSAILQQLKLKSRTQAALLASTMYKQRSADLRGSGTDSSKKTRITKTHNPGRSGVRRTHSWFQKEYCLAHSSGCGAMCALLACCRLITRSNFGEAAAWRSFFLCDHVAAHESAFGP